MQTQQQLDPRRNNTDNFQTGAQVEVSYLGDTTTGFVAKQLDERHFLVRLNGALRFNTKRDRVTPSQWLKVCRDYAHQTVREI